jgi:hypothetical protein
LSQAYFGSPVSIQNFLNNFGDAKIPTFES